jgi:hypothetical protein
MVLHGAAWCFRHEKAVLEKAAWLDESFLLKPLLAARFPPYTRFRQATLTLFTKPFAEVLLNLHRNKYAKMALALFVLFRLGFRVRLVK